MVSDAWMEAQNEALKSSLHLSSGDTCLLGGWLGGTCIRDCKDSVCFSREDAAAADMANPRALAEMASLPRYIERWWSVQGLACRKERVGDLKGNLSSLASY